MAESTNYKLKVYVAPAPPTPAATARAQSVAPDGSGFNEELHFGTGNTTDFKKAFDYKRMLMFVSVEGETIGELRERIVENYRKTFSKDTTIKTPLHVRDADFFVCDDEYLVEDCLAPGSDVFVTRAPKLVRAAKRSAEEEEEAKNGSPAPAEAKEAPKAKKQKNKATTEEPKKKKNSSSKIDTPGKKSKAKSSSAPSKKSSTAPSNNAPSNSESEEENISSFED